MEHPPVTDASSPTGTSGAGAAGSGADRHGPGSRADVESRADPESRSDTDPSRMFTGTLAGALGGGFLAERLSREVVLAEIGREAVAPLLSWDDLNTILASRPVLAPRLRLYRDGEQVPVGSYTRPLGEGGRRREVLRPERLYREMREGASLILDSMEALHEPVTAAAEDLTRWVRAPVQANLYVTFGDSRGFDAHWDDHDTFVVQVLGTKSWTVHGPAREHPLRDDVVPDETCPDRVVWDGVVRAGQVLHVPRGWWHTVRGAGGVSVHLTFGFGRHTGLDWMRWLVEQASEHVLARRDLPRFADARERADHGRRLRELLADLADEHPPGAYLEHCDGQIPRRRRLCLPHGVDAGTIPDDGVVTFTPVLPQLSRGDDGTVRLATDRRRFTFAACMEPMLRTLADRGRLPRRDLARASGLDDDTFRTALELLVEQHLVAVRPYPGTGRQP